MELVELPLAQLLSLFHANPQLSKRFLRHVATSLADRVKAGNDRSSTQGEEGGGEGGAAGQGGGLSSTERWAAVKKAILFSSSLQHALAADKANEEARRSLVEIEGEGEGEEAGTKSSSECPGNVLHLLNLWAKGKIDEAIALAAPKVS